MNADAFVDTNLWLYALVLSPGEEAKHYRAQQLIDGLGRYTISTQVVAEVSVNLLKKAGLAEPTLVEILVDFYRNHRVHQTDLACHRRASDFRTRFAFSFWDSLILASAFESGCSICYSEDMQDGLLIDERLRVVNPFASQDGPG